MMQSNNLFLKNTNKFIKNEQILTYPLIEK